METLYQVKNGKKCVRKVFIKKKEMLPLKKSKNVSFQPEIATSLRSLPACRQAGKDQ